MVRLAEMKDKEAVNALRRQVNDLHVEGRPDIFKPGFCPEIRDHVDLFLTRQSGCAAVDEMDGAILGMVLMEVIDRPENAYNLPRRFLRVVEICVDAAFRRQGVGKRLMDFVKQYARETGLKRVELDVWAFNDALAFYEAEGFTVFRRFLEWFPEEEKKADL